MKHQNDHSNRLPMRFLWPKSKICQLCCVILTTLTDIVSAGEILPVFEAKNVEIIDGDTIRAEVEIWDDVFIKKTFRSSFDTWESFRNRHSKDFQGKSDAWWKEEQRKGNLAKEYFKQLMSKGRLYLSPANQSTYGRDVAHFYYQPNGNNEPLQSLGEMMKKEGHLRQ